MEELERNTGRGRNWQGYGKRKDFRKIGVEAGERKRGREEDVGSVEGKLKKKRKRKRRAERGKS